MARVKLGDVAREYKATCGDQKEGLRVVGLEHLIPQQIILTLWDEGKENTFTKMFKKGQVLFGRRRAYLKKAAVAPFDGICSGDITVIEAIPGKIIPELLPFIIQNDTLFDFAVERSAGSLSPRVKWEHLKNFEFELPELDKQKELADILWASERAKTAYRDLISSTDELVKSQFIEMFLSENSSYETVSLSQVFEKPQGGEWGEDDASGNGTPVLRTTNFTDGGYIDYSDVATRIIDTKKVAKKALLEGDILIEKSGGSGDKPVGRVVFFEGESGKYLNNNFTARLHLADSYEISALYTFYFMYINYWSGGTKLYEGKTTGIHNLMLMDYLQNTQIPLAPMVVQKQFESIARQSDKSKSLCELTAQNRRMGGVRCA